MSSFMKFIPKNCDKNWVWYENQTKPNIKIEVEKYPEIKWDGISLSLNPNITISEIKWDGISLSLNPNITISEINWKYTNLSQDTFKFQNFLENKISSFSFFKNDF